MDDTRTLLALIFAAGTIGPGLVLVSVLDVGMAAAWRGDTETVGTVIIVLVLVIVASLLVGIVGRFR